MIAAMNETEPTATGDDARRWVSIYTCRSREEAHLAVAKLRHHGIEARTDGEEMAMAGMAIFSLPGSVTPLDTKVQVFEADATAARALLKEVDRRRVARLGRLPCPNCGAMNPNRAWPAPRLIAMAFVALAAALLVSRVATGTALLLAFVAGCGVMWPLTPRWRCTTCRHVWLAPDPDLQVEDEEDEDDELADDNDEDDRDDGETAPEAGSKA